MKRVASVIQLRSSSIEEYERLHAAAWPEVLAQIRNSNISNYSIYRYGTLLFSYFEYLGQNLEGDMQKMAQDENTQKWWKLTDPLQSKVAEASPEEWWHQIKEVFHTD